LQAGRKLGLRPLKTPFAKRVEEASGFAKDEGIRLLAVMNSDARGWLVRALHGREPKWIRR